MEEIIIGSEFYKKKESLTLVKQLNWENYYIDNTTGEKWIEEFPHSKMHGGGSPQLRLLQFFPWE